MLGRRQTRSTAHNTVNVQHYKNVSTQTMDARAVTPLESDALSHKYAEHVLKKTCLGLFPLVPAADSKSEA